MANLLIIDDQLWIRTLCKEGLEGEEYQVSVTDDVLFVREKISSFKPDIVLLNLYLKHGVLVWDVLREIKRQNPKLPVIIVAQYETNLFSPRLSEADGYLIQSHTAPDELKENETLKIIVNQILENDLTKLDNDIRINKSELNLNFIIPPK